MVRWFEIYFLHLQRKALCVKCRDTDFLEDGGVNLHEASRLDGVIESGMGHSVSSRFARHARVFNQQRHEIARERRQRLHAAHADLHRT